MNFCRGRQDGFRVELVFARQIHDREKEIAHLVRDRLLVTADDRFLRFAQFFVHFRDHILEFAPIEIDPGRFALRFLREHQGRQRPRRPAR